jgi:hypothetical protein
MANILWFEIDGVGVAMPSRPRFPPAWFQKSVSR